MEINTVDVDDPKNILNPEIHQELYQTEIYNIVSDNIKNQYEKYENLGQNYFLMFSDNLRDSDKLQILNDLIYYTNKNIISLVDIDNLNGNVERTLIAGQYIYEFICIDSFSSLIPAFMETLNITSVDELDNLINLKYLTSPSKFKNDFLTIIRTTIEQLLKLQKITPIVKKDNNYQKLLGKYYYYQELVEYGDTSMFLENYIRPVISKYSSDLIWKLL